jgi:hypothetical protein
MIAHLVRELARLVSFCKTISKFFTIASVREPIKRRHVTLAHNLVQVSVSHAYRPSSPRTRASVQARVRRQACAAQRNHHRPFPPSRLALTPYNPTLIY